MPTEEEIRANYKALHTDLGHRYYELHELTKEEFDYLHGKCWDDMEAELKAGGFIPTIYRYEVFTKEIIHPKKDAPAYIDYQILEFNQKLMPDEISALETELKKTVRKVE